MMDTAEEEINIMVTYVIELKEYGDTHKEMNQRLAIPRECSLIDGLSLKVVLLCKFQADSVQDAIVRAPNLLMKTSYRIA